MADFRQWFRREMRTLEEEGTAFSRDYPEAARWLDSSQVVDRDPYVERLTEGFAYWTGRIRESFEAEEDHVAAHLLQLLAPGSEQPLPSMAVVQFHELSNAPKCLTLERGEMVLARSPASQQSFEYSLLDNVVLHDVDVTEVRLETQVQGKDGLILKLRRNLSSGWNTWPSDLDLYLHADAPVVWALRFALLQTVEGIDARWGDQWIPDPRLEFRAWTSSGYSDAHSPQVALCDVRDFLCQDEKFRYVRLVGLQHFLDSQIVEIRVRLSGSFPRGMARAVQAPIFRPRTGVVINRSEEPAMPIVWDHTREKQILRPLSGLPKELLQLEGVVWRDPNPDVPSRPIPSLSSYKHDQEGEFHCVTRSVEAGKPIARLVLGGLSVQELSPGVVSTLAHWCDGNRPHQNLQPKDFSKASFRFDGCLALEGLTRPSRCHRGLWTTLREGLLAYATGHHQGWCSTQNLPLALRLAQWDEARSKSWMIDCVQSVQEERGFLRHRGTNYSVRKVRIVARDPNSTLDTWERLGLWDALGWVLFALAKEETDMGSVTQLDLHIDPCGRNLFYSSMG